jgi:hypothetical protein
MTAPTTTQSLRPKAAIEWSEADEFCHAHFTVWMDYPDAGVTRPRSYGISCGNNRRLADRLARAVDAGVVMIDPEVRTDIYGGTYVSSTSVVSGKRLNADLKRLGY